MTIQIFRATVFWYLVDNANQALSWWIFTLFLFFRKKFKNSTMGRRLSMDFVLRRCHVSNPSGWVLTGEAWPFNEFLNIVLFIFQMHPILQGGSVPPASNSRMPPLPHEPAGFYNDRGATVDIPLDSTKVHDLPLSLLLLRDSMLYK